MKKVALSIAIATIFCGCGGGSDNKTAVAPQMYQNLAGVTSPSTTITPVAALKVDVQPMAQNPAVAPITNFNFLSAYKKYLLARGVSRYAVTGTCTGKVYQSDVVTKNASGLGVASVYEDSYTNCGSLNRFTYSWSSYNVDYDLKHISYCSTKYSCVNSQRSDFTKLNELPLIIKDGDIGIYGNLLNYDDSARHPITYIGHTEIGYLVVKDGDSPDSIIFNIIYKDYDANKILQSTQMNRFRLYANETIEQISFYMLFPNGTSLTGIKQ
jgi:hypothetical protein